MRSISIPVRIVRGGLARTENTKQAIDRALSLLLTTPCFSSAADPGFGFIFNNLKFENVNEHEGVVSNKKLSGSSKNINTYAAELQKTIMQHEPRLQDIKVSMTYMREEKKIYTTVEGTISATQEPYQFSTTIKVWR